MATLLTKIAHGVGKAVTKSVGKTLVSLPGVGTAYTAGKTLISAMKPAAPKLLTAAPVQTMGAFPIPAYSGPVQYTTPTGGGSVPTIPSIYAGADSALFGGLLPGGAPPLPGYLSPASAGTGLTRSGGGGSLQSMVLAQAVASGQIPLVTQPATVTVARAPAGYVLVRLPDGSQRAVLKELAYATGLKRRPSKRGGISSRDMQTAARVQKYLSAHTVARKPKGAIVSKGRKK